MTFHKSFPWIRPGEFDQPEDQARNMSVGGIGILILVVAFYGMHQTTAPGEYILHQGWLLYTLTVIWIILSLSYRLLLLFGINNPFVGWSALCVFALCLIAVGIFVEQIVPFQQSIFYSLLTSFCLFVTLLIDFACPFFQF